MLKHGVSSRMAGHALIILLLYGMRLYFRRKSYLFSGCVMACITMVASVCVCPRPAESRKVGMSI